MSVSRTPSTFARILYWPVYFFIERVRFARSLLLLLLLIPDGYVAYMLLKQTTKDVQFSAKESQGIAWITPAREFLATVQRLRVVGRPGLPPEVASEVAALTARGDEQVRKVDAADAEHGGALGTTETWARAKIQWEALRRSNFTDAPSRDKAFTELSTLIAVELILNLAGNNSNLILDPDLDSYWLMDAYVIKLPLLGELASSSAAGALESLSDGKMEMDERLGLAATLGLMASTGTDLINVDLKAAIEYNEKSGNKRVKAQLEDKFMVLSKALAEYEGMLREKLLLPVQAVMSTPDLARAGAQLVDAVQALQVAVGPELDRLCYERADRYRDTRFFGMVIFVIAALLISYVFNGFTNKVKENENQLIAENARQAEDIRSLLEVVSNAADGDLTSRAKVGDGVLGNVADAFNQMMESWQELIGAIIKQLDATARAVDGLGSASEAMAQGASVQAQSLSAAEGQVLRMSDELTRVSDTASNAAGAAERTRESAQQGAQSVADVMRGMEALRSLVQAGAKKVKNLGDRSMEIGGIVGTIATISEQTNMLAINASIEAARAGDQGRGFSVVADEVRKLAERTAVATQEIDKLVRAIQAETAESVGAIERQTQVVEDEGRAVATAGQALGRIEEVSTRSSGLAADINSTARNHVNEARTVVDAIQRISAIAKDTEQRAQGSREVVQQLDALALTLRQSIGRFKV